MHGRPTWHALAITNMEDWATNSPDKDQQEPIQLKAFIQRRLIIPQKHEADGPSVVPFDLQWPQKDYGS
eukprot:1154255-Pelagomonas_calceolata.AAC.1